jgi:hypothetical protein
MQSQSVPQNMRSHVQLKTDSILEVKEFIASRLEQLQGERLEIRRNESGVYLAEIVPTSEPIT